MAKTKEKRQKKKGRSTQELIGVKSFTKDGLETQKGELLFYLVVKKLPTISQPTF